jgi:hypothetical protein
MEACVLVFPGERANDIYIATDLLYHVPHSPFVSVLKAPPMDKQLLFVCLLTFVIHIIGTLAYSVRIAGVRTRRIAVSFALFSILVLVSRTSNSFLSPLLAKRVESNLTGLDAAGSLLSDFRWLLLSASIATVVGALLIPTFQRVFCRAVLHFQVHRSVPKLIPHGFFKGGLSYLKGSASLPAAANVTALHKGYVRHDRRRGGGPGQRAGVPQGGGLAGRQPPGRHAAGAALAGPFRVFDCLRRTGAVSAATQYNDRTST